MSKTIKTKPPEMTEKQWSKQFSDLFRMLGWEGYHPYLSIHSERGWPDWSLVNLKQGRFICVELKAQKGKTTVHQDKWIANLNACGVECYVWRPADFQLAADILTKKPVGILEATECKQELSEMSPSLWIGKECKQELSDRRTQNDTKSDLHSLPEPDTRKHREAK